MIQVALFQGDARVGEVEFYRLPLDGEGSYRCTPDGIVSSSCLWKIADALRRGDMNGYASHHRWCRQASATPANALNS